MENIKFGDKVVAVENSNVRYLSFKIGDTFIVDKENLGIWIPSNKEYNALGKDMIFIHLGVGWNRTFKKVEKNYEEKVKKEYIHKDGFKTDNEEDMKLYCVVEEAEKSFEMFWTREERREKTKFEKDVLVQLGKASAMSVSPSLDEFIDMLVKLKKELAEIKSSAT